MQRFRADREAARAVEAYGSRGTVALAVQHSAARLVVTRLWIEPEGEIGSHEAPVDQLFLVIAGSGWALDSGGGRTPLTAGQAVFWRAGERHGVVAGEGLSAVVLEGEGLVPDAHLAPLEEG